MFTRWIVSVVLLGISFAAVVAPAQPRDSIGHDRHTRHHNTPHQTTEDSDRFHTSREGREFPLAVEEDAFTFAVFGDRTGGPVEGVSVLADAVHDVNLLEPDLVMTVGDLVQGYGGTREWLRQMEEFRGIMDELLCPWFPVAGNHDVYWRNGPIEGHEPQYEMHFGPLWYAFEHKSSWFIALYSDEGNPDTGERSIRDPAAQVMSEEQFTWLQGILEQASDADHIFLFLHHPRWLTGRYGDDWNRVHEMLVEAGNVSAVFAGHIHRMRYDPRDGIEYITLATVGGGQAGHAPEMGWLHQYHTVTVRENQIAVAAVPVGEVLDPRRITGLVSEDGAALAQMALPMDGATTLGQDGAAEDRITVTLRNPAHERIEATLVPAGGDTRWLFSPDHTHMRLAPGASREFELTLSRVPSPLDETFRPPQLSLRMDYLADGFRYPLPNRRVDIPLDLSRINPTEAEEDLILNLDGDGDVLEVPSDVAALPDGPFTLEAWFLADSFSGRTGLVTKTQGSEYGIFVSDGEPSFTVHLDGQYSGAGSDGISLETGSLYHIAGVFDGSEIRLYLDGDLIASGPAAGSRTTNELPLMVGADVDGEGHGTSFFPGKIHEVRLSTGARYSGDSFEPDMTLRLDDSCVFHTRFDSRLGPWVFDLADRGETARLRGGARLVPAD